MVAFFKNLSLKFFHLSMSFGVSFSGSHHESVHVLINSFLGVTKFFFELVVELILVVGLLIQLFDSSDQNEVSFFLSIEQVHEVSLQNRCFIHSASDFSSVSLCLLFSQFAFESFNGFFHHVCLFLAGTVLLLALGLLFFIFLIMIMVVVSDLIGSVLLNDDTSIVAGHVALANFVIISSVGVDNRDIEVKSKEAISDRQFHFFVLLAVELTNVEISFSEDSIRFSLGATVDLDNNFFVLNLILVDKELRDK